MRTKFIVAATLGILSAGLVPCQARVTKFVIQERSSFAGGMSWGQAGPYELLRGVARMQVNPRDSLNALIVDLNYAQRNARGMVEFNAPFVILKPVDMSRGNHKMFFTINNRGNGLGLLNSAIRVTGDEPMRQIEVALRLGYSIVDAGWEGDIIPAATKLVADLPIAKQVDGRPIIGTMRYEYSDRATGTFTTNLEGSSAFRSYPAADTNPDHAKFTVRDSVDGPKTVIPSNYWAFGKCPTGRASLVASDVDVCYFDGFVNNKIYELTYLAKDPIVMGLGFAVARDIGAFLRYEMKDEDGSPNPLGPVITRSYATGESQVGGYLRDFIYLGFNEDESRRKVFDGIIIRIAGTDRLFLNVRFADPNTYSEQDNHHDFLQNSYPPFTYAVTLDPISGIRDGIMKRPKMDPLVMQIDSDSEFWQLHGSLNVADGLGRSVKLPQNVRLYLQGNTAHRYVTGGLLDPPPDMNPQCVNPTPAAHVNWETFRAALVNLDNWADRNIAPPPSNYPTVEAGTLVNLREASDKFPKTSRIGFPTVVDEYKLIDFGPQFGSKRSIPSLQPPHLGRSYVILVPKTDSDGIDIAGVRPMQARVPLGTGTGWNIRKPDHRGPNLCGLTGSYIAFARTKAVRLANADPRPSLEERYGSHDGFVKSVDKAARELVNERFLLEDDAEIFVTAAKASDVLN